MPKATFNVGNVFTSVVADDAAYELLDAAFSYFVKGAERTWQFKQKKWDGKKRLFTKTHRFPTGLLNEAKDLLDAYTITVLDLRVKPDHEMKKWNLFGADPREHQIDAYIAAIEQGRGVIFHATGAGKTEVMAAVTQMLDLPTLVLVNQGTPARQTAERFKLRLQTKNVGLYAGGKKQDKKIVVATFQTLDAQAKRDKENQTQVLKSWLNRFEVLCVDEGHHLMAKTYQAIANQCDAYYRFAFSATPEKTKDRGAYLHIVGTTGPIIDTYTPGEGVTDGHLVPADIKMIKWWPTKPKTDWSAWQFEIDDSQYTYSGVKNEKYQVLGRSGKMVTKTRPLPSHLVQPGLYETAIVNNDVRNGFIVDAVSVLVDDGLTVLLLVDWIDHGLWLQRAIQNEIRAPVGFLWGKHDEEERQEGKRKLEQGSTPVLIASTIFDEGVDIPAIDGLVFAGGQRAEHRYIQRLGRGMRPNPKTGKTVLTVVDFMDTHSRIMWRQSKARLNAYKSDLIGYHVEIVEVET